MKVEYRVSGLSYLNTSSYIINLIKNLTPIYFPPSTGRNFRSFRIIKT